MPTNLIRSDSSEITDQYMQAQLAKAKPFVLVLLTAAPRTGEAAADQIVWEHGRRNFKLRAEGKLPIVCPVTDDSDLAGIGIFDGTPEEVARILADDPGVKAVCSRTRSTRCWAWQALACPRRRPELVGRALPARPIEPFTTRCRNPDNEKTCTRC
jgi:hypothetical protein